MIVIYVSPIGPTMGTHNLHFSMGFWGPKVVGNLYNPIRINSRTFPNKMGWFDTVGPPSQGVLLGWDLHHLK